MSDDSDYDPDYREDSDDSDESDIPKSMARDRARWVEDHVGPLSVLYGQFLEQGRAYFGNAFFQTGSINQYCKLVYKYSMPGAS